MNRDDQSDLRGAAPKAPGDAPGSSPSRVPASPAEIRRLLAWTVVVATAFWAVCLFANGACTFDDALRYAANGRSIMEAHRPFAAPVSWTDFNSGGGAFGHDRLYANVPFSALLALLYSVLGRARLWYGVIPAYVFFVLGSCMLALYLRRFLRGWQFWAILGLAIGNPVVLRPAVDPATDGVAWGLLMFALWRSCAGVKRPFLAGLAAGLAAALRAPAVLFAVPLPILLVDRWRFKPVVAVVGRLAAGAVLSIAVVQGSLWLALDRSDQAPRPAASAEKSAIAPERTPGAGAAAASESAGPATSLSWYLREMRRTWRTFDPSWLGRWLVEEAWATFGPKSPLFGFVLFVTCFLLLCRADDPSLQRERWFAIIAVALTCLATGINFTTQYTHRDPAVALAPSRYFAPLVPSILLTYWMFARQHLFPSLRFSDSVAATLRRVRAGRLAAATGLNILLLAAIVLTYSGGGIVQSLATLALGKRAPIAPAALAETERQLSTAPASALFATNYSEFVNLHHPTRKIVTLPPTFAEFAGGARNGELEGLVFFFRNPDERKRSAWGSEVEQPVLVDQRGNRFTRTLARSSPWFEIYLFRREGAAAPSAGPAPGREIHG